MLLRFTTLAMLLLGLTVSLAPGADKAKKKNAPAAGSGSITGYVTASEVTLDGNGTITVEIRPPGAKKGPDAPRGEVRKFTFTRATTVQRVKSNRPDQTRPSNISELAVGLLVHVYAKGDVASKIEIEERQR
jgi:hypothetical protein